MNKVLSQKVILAGVIISFFAQSMFAAGYENTSFLREQFDSLAKDIRLVSKKVSGTKLTQKEEDQLTGAIARVTVSAAVLATLLGGGIFGLKKLNRWRKQPSFRQGDPETRQKEQQQKRISTPADFLNEIKEGRARIQEDTYNQVMNIIKERYPADNADRNEKTMGALKRLDAVFTGYDVANNEHKRFVNIYFGRDGSLREYEKLRDHYTSKENEGELARILYALKISLNIPSSYSTDELSLAASEAIATGAVPNSLPKTEWEQYAMNLDFEIKNQYATKKEKQEEINKKQRKQRKQK